MLLTVLIIILLLMVVGALPTWGYSASWGTGYWPSGLGLILIVVLLVLLLRGA
jgi:hypothetical protein